MNEQQGVVSNLSDRLPDLYKNLDWWRFPRDPEQLVRHLSAHPREVIHAIQSHKFKQVVQYAWDHIPFYRWLWGEAGVSPEHIRDIDDIVKLPTWNKQIQRMALERKPPFGDYYSYDDLSEANYVVSTSGTTGNPVMMLMKQEDVEGLQDIYTRSFRHVGVNERDIVQIVFPFSTSGAAWAGYWASQGVGALIIPTSSGKITPSTRQVYWIKHANVTVIYGTASYIRHLAEVAKAEGIDPAQTAVRKIVTAGEMVSPLLRKEIEELWGAEMYDLFGTVDTQTWSSIDCAYSRQKFGETGMHIWEDAVKIEILDEQGQHCADGEYGNLTITSWAYKNSPRIRYSMGDAAAVTEQPCPCGCGLARMLPVRGRMDDMIRIKAQNIYPMAIENLLKSFGVVEYMVETFTEGGSDHIAITVEHPTEDQAMLNQIEKKFAATFNVTPIMKWAAPGSTAPMTGAGLEAKIRRIFDRRQR
jgi:phenylacetate-CoA ligase